MNILHRVSSVLLSVAVLLGGSGLAEAANTGSPQQVKLKFFELWVSPHTDCSNMTKIYDEANPSYQDMVAGPTFGELHVANGTYQCIAWKMSDIVTVVPDFNSDGGLCVRGQPYVKDLFRVGDSAVSPTGETITATTSTTVPDNMWVYLSTTGLESNSANSPSSPAKLQNAYVVSADNVATLVADFTNGIQDTGSACSPEQVTFGFRYNL